MGVRINRKNKNVYLRGVGASLSVNSGLSLLLVVSLELEVTGVMPGTGFIAWEVGSSARVLEYSGLEPTIVAKEEDGSNDWDKVER